MELEVSSNNKPRVAFLPCPGMGHMIPHFEFAKLLVKNHNILVSFLVITTDASAAQNQFFESPNIPQGIRIVNIPPADMSNIIDENTLVLSRICLTVQESLKPLRSILAEVNPKVLIIDLFTSEAIDLAKQLSISVYTFTTASAGFLAFSLYLPTLDREVEEEFVDLPHPINVPGCRPERIEDLLDQVRNRKIDEYKWFLFHMDRLRLADGIFENSWEDLEPLALKAVREHAFFKSIQTPPVYPIGPLIKPDEFIAEKDAKIIAWLDNQPPDSVLFVVFGSGGTLTSEQLTELAWGLEMSEQRFILVARKPSDASASAAYFNVGNDQNDDPSVYLPEGFVERTKRVGIIVSSWAPQAAILGHGSTGAFLSHCGWNSCLESLSHGVPILAWPLYAEQKMNATQLEDGVDVAVKPVVQKGEKKVIGREEIERVVRLIMEGEEGMVLRSRAKQLKLSAEKALSYGGSSYNSVCRVVDIWKSLI
ncbi:hypothetical protein ACH5RR_035113 [Cinchona calisaya]|uniref:Glycosyltransferase n=1 Tax=Cinchona calisaya TaxID=153742 RepID=A0ABD2YCW8_9GENT